MKNLFLSLSFLFSLLIISCNRSSDESTRATFSIQQYTAAAKTSSSTTAKAAATGTFTFAKALVGISKIDFEMDKTKPDQEIKYTTPFQFNILTGVSTPPVNEVNIVPGVYHELEFKIDSILTSGNSIEIAGTYNDGTKTYQFEYTTNARNEYEIENSTGITVTNGQVTTFLLKIDLKALFNGVDFSTATVGTDNVIRINATSNLALANIIKHNIEANFENEMHFEHGGNHD